LGSLPDMATVIQSPCGASSGSSVDAGGASPTSPSRVEP
jgi:hypothetical protein